MDRRNLLWAALLGIPVALVGGLAYAKPWQGRAYTCPLTGEELACEECCPLYDVKAASSNSGQPPVRAATGDEAACPKCCALSERK